MNSLLKIPAYIQTTWNKHSRFITYFLFIFFFLSCRERVSLGNFDSEVWKNDRKACENARVDLVEAFKREQDQLLGKSEAAILQVLGRPDFQELASRNQKYYYYYYKEGVQCSDNPPRTHEGTVQIRINSLGYANEVLFN